jgi:hypothetical protein
MNLDEIKFRYYDSAINAFVYSDQQKTRNVFKQASLFFKAASLHGRGEVEIDIYTTLKDKNGNHIYENDIVSIAGYSSKFPVVFECGEFHIDNDEYLLLADNSNECVVVGNIHTGLFDES